MAVKHQQRREVTKAMQAGYYESVPHSMAGIKERLTETISTITRLREDVAKVSDPRVRALFDTTREVLKDLVAAYDLYEGAKTSFDLPEDTTSAQLALNSRGGEA